MKYTEEEIIAQIKELSEAAQVSLHNAYCENGNYDSYIDYYDADYMERYDINEAIRMATRSDHFDCYDNYIVVNRTTNTFETTDFPSKYGWICYEDVANFLLDTVPGEKMAREYGIEIEYDDDEEL